MSAVNKHFDAILFDLDATLVQMPQERFATEATAGLTRFVAPRLGVSDKDFLAALNAGIGAMIKNDGSSANRDVFFDVFSERLSRAAPDKRFDEKKAEALFTGYYLGDFREIVSICTYNLHAREAVREARRLADRVVVATLPIFPACAQEERLKWIDLAPTDFDLVTDYSFSHFSKPDVRFYLEIARHFSLDPARTLMVGNDLSDDILPALAAGMRTYLVTDCLLNGHLPYDGPRSDFAAFTAYLKSL